MLNFSPATFEALLKAINKYGYTSVTFNEEIIARHLSSRVVALRHDVDVSMDFALQMAEQEAKLGVQASYFVMLRSPMYNLMSRHSSEVLRKIIELGHEVALHFDASYCQGEERTIEEWILFEAKMLQILTNKPVHAFSFHQPSQEIIDKKIEVEGLINTYHPGHLIDFEYLSDSNRVWQNVDPFNFLQSGVERIHLLLHPIWWMCKLDNIEDCWDEAVRQNYHRMQQQLLATERAYGSARDIQLTRRE